MRRLSKQSDFDKVYEIYFDEKVIDFLGYDPISKEEFQSIFSNLVASKAFWIYEVDGEVVGFYKADRLPGRAQHVAYIGTLAVSPKYQGKGLGKEMMKEAFAKLQKQGVRRIELMVEEDNPKAIGFYESLGFKREAVLKDYYKRSHQDHYINEVLMVLFV